MSKKKWLIAAAAAVALVFMGLGIVFLALVAGFFAGHETAAAEPGLAVYKSEQVPSPHPGYRRTTLTSGTEVYVNDYEEQALWLMNPDPTQVIGRYGLGNGKICAIPGQPTTAYIAADVGSEMPAFAVFRNTSQPRFDWRTAKFREMQITRPDSGRTVLRSSDPAILAAVVRTLGEGAVGEPPTAVSMALSNLVVIYLYSDQLAGVAFCPSVYFDPSGPIYLSESVWVEPSKTNTTVHARWVAAEEKLAAWLMGPADPQQTANLR